VHALDLHVEHRVLVDDHLAVEVDPLRQLPLVVQLDRLPLRLELRLLRVLLERAQLRHVQRPLVSLQVLGV